MRSCILESYNHDLLAEQKNILNQMIISYDIIHQHVAQCDHIILYQMRIKEIWY